MKRIFLVLAVGALMAVMIVAMAAPAFARPGNGNDVNGNHNGYGGDPYQANNFQGDEQNYPGLRGNAYGDYNN